ncbi:MGMT family protein [Corynebacterium sp. HMSC036D02]|uniref:MGMT family protein n=1 Tax=Corynebacterium sp. HMSC036D02 TaxID=1715013 RepID=UPI0008A9A0ED|nr:MGMT family protein [Corynebacterium sp. HMSC036D02]OHO63345.1 cysteine methyltransferase [Corynebacterium sp. HMSC036D02]
MPPKNPSSSRVTEVVLRIPLGNVSTYGEIAKVAGVGPRYVGWGMSKSADLPWWRVVNSTGRAHTSAAQAHWDEEGIPHRGDRVVLSECGLDAADLGG